MLALIFAAPTRELNACVFVSREIIFTAHEMGANMGRFNYVAYDEIAQRDQQELKGMMESLESRVDTIEPLGQSASRAKALIYTKLEEAYMWMGKLVRDNQVARTRESTEVPGRSNE